MVEFLYTKAYDNPTEEQGSEGVSGSETTKADIPQLKKLANTKIQHIIETNWSPHGFSEIVKEAFNSTTDRELREIMSSTTAAHIEELLEFEDFTELGVIGDFAIGKADRINHFLKILSKIQSYRNCDADFTCYVERGGTSYEPQYTLRCTKCHCRHKYIPFQ